MKGLSPLFTSKTRQDAWKNLRKSLNALKNKPGMTSQKAFKAVFSARGFNYLANETAGMIKGVSHAVVFGMVYDSALAMAGIKPAEGKLGFLRNHTISLIATIIGMGAINKWFVKPRLIAGPNGTKVLPKGMARAGAALGALGAAVVVEGMVFQNFLKPSTQSAVAEVQQALGKKSWGFLFDNGTFIGRVNTAIYYGDKVKVRAVEVQKEAREAQKDLGKYFVLREKGGLRKDSSYYSNISADHADIKHVNKYFSRPVFLSEEMQKIAYEYAQAKTRRSWLLQEVPELKGKINLIFTNTYNKREDIVFKKNAEELIKKYIKDPQKQKFMLELAKKKPRSIQDIDGAARICLRDKESFTDKSTIGEKINRKNGASYYQYVELKKLNGSTDLNILDIFGVFLMQQSMANRVAVYKEMGEKAFLSHFRVIKGQEYPGVSPHKQAVVIRSPKRYLEYAARYSVTSDEKKMILAARRKHRMNQLINAAVQNKKVVYHLEEYTKILPDIQAGFLKQIYVDLPTGGKSAAYTINEDNATYIAIMTRKYKGMRQIYMMAKREAEKKGAKLDTMIQFLALENKLKSMVIDLWKVAMNGGEDSKRYIALLMGVERSQIDAKLAQIGLNKEFLVKLRSVESKPKKKTRDFLMHMAMVNLIKRKIVLG